MLRRTFGYLVARDPAKASEASQQLERDGYTVLRGVFTDAEIEALRQDIDRVFDEYPRDNRAGDLRPADEDDMFRYEMFNRSDAALAAVAKKAILDTIEPLLGEDCHIIANTAWRNLAHHEGTHGGQAWHIDAGPHIPLREGETWPADLPHPVFAIGTHIFLKDCGPDDGPTGVIPGSHLSGRFPPREQFMDPDLTWQGNAVVPLLAKAGDVAMFVSDIWHRRMPAGPDDAGRYFLQVHYGRRDIAQRVQPTSQTNHVAKPIRENIEDDRARLLLGLHPSRFYDG